MQKQLVSELVGMDSKLSGIPGYAGAGVTIQLTEAFASDELRHYCERLIFRPNRLFEPEQRIAKQISLARKHHVSPEALPQLLSVTARRTAAARRSGRIRWKR